MWLGDWLAEQSGEAEPEEKREAHGSNPQSKNAWVIAVVLAAVLVLCVVCVVAGIVAAGVLGGIVYWNSSASVLALLLLV